MFKILFVCHGNICRSPMAEFLCKYLVENKGLEDKFYISSCATSEEEIGNPVHRGTKKILSKYGIDCSSKTARQMTKADYDNYDYIIAMDQNNINNLKPFVGSDPDNKVHLLLKFANINRGIRDPWYTRNFEETEEDISLGLNYLLQYLINKL